MSNQLPFEARLVHFYIPYIASGHILHAGFWYAILAFISADLAWPMMLGDWPVGMRVAVSLLITLGLFFTTVLAYSLADGAADSWEKKK